MEEVRSFTGPACVSERGRFSSYPELCSRPGKGLPVSQLNSDLTAGLAPIPGDHSGRSSPLTPSQSQDKGEISGLQVVVINHKAGISEKRDC